MGLLDTIASVANGLGKEQGANQSLMDGVMDLFKGGGLKGLIDTFAKSGLEDVVKSWIGTGANKDISVDELTSALGKDKLEELANRAGIPVDQTSGLLKELLPRIIDKVTPNGKISDE